MPGSDQSQSRSQVRVLRHGNTRQAKIALTFDDGPSAPHTVQILDVLRFYRVQATFFCIGKQVEQFPSVVERMQKEGHSVGNHTWSHTRLTELADPQEVTLELAQCTRAIEQVTGVCPGFFRPPYGRYNAQVLSSIQECNMIPVLWNVDPKDWTQPGANVIYQIITEQANNGAIILLHDGGGDRSHTVESLPQILQWSLQHNICLVTLLQMIGRSRHFKI